MPMSYFGKKPEHSFRGGNRGPAIRPADVSWKTAAPNKWISATPTNASDASDDKVIKETNRMSATFCKALINNRTCHAPLGEHAEDGFCDSCWYDGITDVYAYYRALRKEGIPQKEAAQQAGIDT